MKSSNINCETASGLCCKRKQRFAPARGGRASAEAVGHRQLRLSTKQGVLVLFCMKQNVLHKKEYAVFPGNSNSCCVSVSTGPYSGLYSQLLTGSKAFFYWGSLEKVLKTLSSWPDVSVLVQWCPCLGCDPSGLQSGPWGSRPGHPALTPTPIDTHRHPQTPTHTETQTDTQTHSNPQSNACWNSVAGFP